MQRKVFWISFLMLGFTADLILPLLWGIVSPFRLRFFAGGLPTKAIGLNNFFRA